MEPQTGVFVASLTTDEWEPDPDVGGLMHVLCDVPGVQAGFTRFDTAPDPVPWTPPLRETFLILQGAARIEIGGGPTLELNEGDAASLAAGTATTWHITAPFREFWVLSGPETAAEAAVLDVEILAEALHAQYRLQRPGGKPMSDSVVQAMASYIASQYDRLAAEKAGQ